MLTAETRTREATEPSGEPETLWNNMKGKMGDRVQYGKPEEDRKKTKKRSGICKEAHTTPSTFTDTLSMCEQFSSRLQSVLSHFMLPWSNRKLAALSK